MTLTRTSVRPPRVAHILGILDRGGAETVCLDLCRAIPPGEVEQSFVTLGSRPGSLEPDFRAAGATVHPCPLSPVGSLVPRLWQTFRALRPDVVVSHVGLTSAAMLLVARLAGVPVRVARIQSEGDGRSDTPARRAWRAFMRRLLRRCATDVLGVTGAALAFTHPPAGDRRYRVLFNSVDPGRVAGWDRAAARRRWAIPDDVAVLAQIGRAHPVKNRPFTVEVFRALRASSPGARLVIAGPGGVGDLVAAHPGIADDPDVELAHETDEIASVLAAADVVLLPSLWEGLPGVVLEALAAGTPVLASDLPCLREVAAHVDGLTLLPLADGADRWAHRAAALAHPDPAVRDGIRRRFATSPFLLNHAAREWRSLWGADADRSSPS